MRGMEKAPSTSAPEPSTTPSRQSELRLSTPPPPRASTTFQRPIPVPIAASSASFDTALTAHLMASRALADAAVKYLADSITKVAGDVEFTVELTAAGASRLDCPALPEHVAQLLQTAVVDKLSFAVLATTGHAPVHSHAAAMTWQSTRVRISTNR